VAALVLRRLLDAAAAPGATFEVAAVVSQPGRPRGRGSKRAEPQPSPVECLARDAGLPDDRILCPERAGDAAFLATLRALQPDLCVTAAYGNYLPTSFLSIPPQGTLNIHPSLLPLYRGAAPVQRALQDGAAITGVTLLFTVKEMDAGPVLAQREVEVPPNAQAPEALDLLFSVGVEMLLEELPGVWAGSAAARTRSQDGAAATHAAKLTRDEGLLDFGVSAARVHNHVRAMAGWPGTYHTFDLIKPGSNAPEALELKVLRTQTVLEGDAAAAAAADRWVISPCDVVPAGDTLLARCGDGAVLRLLEVQAPGRKAMGAADFANGLKGATLRWRPSS
jgi:methionyl-tRNA formyltransferase